jgi:uncharacterized protein
VAFKQLTLAQLKAGAADGLGEDGEFKAYASVFNNVDSYDDIVEQGAFVQSIKEDYVDRGQNIPVLSCHRMDDLDFNIGHVISAVEDERGLLIHGKLDLTNPKGLQAYKLLKGKRINQLSFAYDVKEWAIDENGHRLLKKLKIYEVSIVPIGANQETEVLSVKGAQAKAGRALSAKNSEKLTAVLASLKDAVAVVETLLNDSADQVDEDEAKSTSANGSEPGKDDDSTESKSDDSTRDPSADLVAAEVELKILALS